jgi:hypothetical protein
MCIAIDMGIDLSQWIISISDSKYRFYHDSWAQSALKARNYTNSRAFLTCAFGSLLDFKIFSC